MLKYAISEKQKLAVIEYSGELDYATIVRYMNAIWDDPACNSEYSAICDFSRVKLNMSPKDIGAVFFEIMADERSLKGPCALVLTTPLETALGLIFKNNAKKDSSKVPAMPVQIFYKWENACEFVQCFTDKNSFEWKIVE